VRTVAVPRLTRRTDFRVGSSHEEVRDPFRSGPQGEAVCGF
jgi:hypothetical protein